MFLTLCVCVRPCAGIGMRLCKVCLSVCYGGCLPVGMTRGIFVVNSSKPTVIIELYREQYTERERRRQRGKLLG